MAEQFLITEVPADSFVLLLFTFTVRNSMVLIAGKFGEKAGQQGAYMKSDVMKR